MPKSLKTNAEVSQGVRDFLKHLLESGKVKGILALKKMGGSKAVSYAFMTSTKELAEAEPLAPLMPANAGKILSELTLKEAFGEPVAAFLRPCELRAFTELLKRLQGNRENLLLISPICGGVFPLKSMADGSVNEKVPAYQQAARLGKNAEGLRAACRACTDFIPCQADITVAFAGGVDSNSSCRLFLDTPRGEEFARGAPGAFGEEKLETRELAGLREERAAQKAALFQDVGQAVQGPSALAKTFSACLGCHGCSHVCPICHCLLCVFESKMHDSQPEGFDAELERKGGTRIPAGTLFFHIGRMIHMAVSCVQCGMCSDVCPVDIPVTEVFSLVGDSLQKVLEYVPGRDVEEPVPSGTYKEEEFAQFGEQ